MDAPEADPAEDPVEVPTLPPRRKRWWIMGGLLGATALGLPIAWIERANPAKKLLVEERGASKREKDEMVKDLKRTKVFRGGLLLGVLGGSLSEGID